MPPELSTGYVCVSTPLTVTVAPTWKPLPWTSIIVPPLLGPEFGKMRVMIGAGTVEAGDDDVGSGVGPEGTRSSHPTSRPLMTRTLATMACVRKRLGMLRPLPY